MDRRVGFWYKTDINSPVSIQLNERKKKKIRPHTNGARHRHYPTVASRLLDTAWVGGWRGPPVVSLGSCGGPRFLYIDALGLESLLR